MKRSFPATFNQTLGQPSAPKMPLCRAVAFAVGLGLSMLPTRFMPPLQAAAIRCRASMTRCSLQ